MIHLKHNLKFEPNTVAGHDLSFWKIIAKHRTQCWLVVQDTMVLTEYIGDVTCRDCIEAYNTGV